MNYRLSEILADESIATAATKVIDINLADVISRISIEIKSTNVDNTPVGHVAKMLKRVEIVDGSNVIFSLKGPALQGMSFYDTGLVPCNFLNYVAPAQIIGVFHINFGRKLYDPLLALDPKKFSNLQLKIEHDESLGGCSPTASTMRAFADCFDQKAISPRGYLCSKEHFSVADSSSSVDYVDLPTDYLMRKMIIQGLADDKYPYQQCNAVKLSEEHDKRVILEGSCSDMIKLFDYQWPMYEELLVCYAATAEVRPWITPTYVPHFVGIPDDSGAAALCCDHTGGAKQSLTSDGNSIIRALVQGRCPHGCMVYPFGDQDDPEDWYDVSRLGSLRLKMTQGSSVDGSETIYVLTQQLRTY